MLQKVIVRIQELVHIHQLAVSSVVVALYCFDSYSLEGLQTERKDVCQLHEGEQSLGNDDAAHAVGSVACLFEQWNKLIKLSSVDLLRLLLMAVDTRRGLGFVKGNHSRQQQGDGVDGRIHHLVLNVGLELSLEEPNQGGASFEELNEIQPWLRAQCPQG